MMQDRKASDSGYLVPGTWYLTPVSHSHISNLNRALLVTRHSLLVTPSLHPFVTPSLLFDRTWTTRRSIME
jgi:hypothetical protein